MSAVDTQRVEDQVRRARTALRTLTGSSTHPAAPATERERRVEELASALSRPEAAHWVGMDLADVLDRDALAEALVPSGARGRAYKTELARNTLVLLPVVLTWLAIAMAIRAYGQLNATQKESPFMVLWAEHFGGKLAFPFWLEVVTVVDVAILLVVIGCTIYVHRHQRRAEEALARAERQVDGALAEARLALALLATTTPEHLVATFGMVARQMIDHLEAQEQRLAEAEQRRERESFQLVDFAQNLKDGLGELVEVTRTFADRFPQLAEAIETTAEGLKSLQTRLGEVQGWLAVVSGQLTKIQEGQATITGQNERMLASIAGAANTLGTAATTVAGAADTLNTSVHTFSRDAERLAQGSDSFLATLQEQSKAQGAIAARVADVTIELREMLRGVRQEAESFRLMAVDLHRMKDVTPEVVEQQRVAGEQLARASEQIAAGAKGVANLVAEVHWKLARPSGPEADGQAPLAP